MAARKGQIPSHIQKKQFTHPSLDHPIIQALERIEDFRRPSQFFRHSLTSVIFMVLVAQVCGAKDREKVIKNLF